MAKAPKYEVWAYKLVPSSDEEGGRSPEGEKKSEILYNLS